MGGNLQQSMHRVKWQPWANIEMKTGIYRMPQGGFGMKQISIIIVERETDIEFSGQMTA